MREVLAFLHPVASVYARHVPTGIAILEVEDRVLGLIRSDEVYIKSDSETAKAFQDAGCARFDMEFWAITIDYPFWRLPDDAQICSEPMLAWASLGLDVLARESGAA